MANDKKLTAILIPGLTVFISSACIMVIELVAGRLIARHLGSSLYTWTSVIGVVLAGITLGNYIGGRIADKFNTRKALSWLFVISAACCLLTVFISNAMGSWPLLWKFGFLPGVMAYVFAAFFLPACILGAISPVVAKMALDQGLPTGRTVGDIYACGAAGSILGTFATGYYLIAAMGTVQIIWAVSAVLTCMGIGYAAWKREIRVAVVLFCFLAGLAFLLMGPGSTAKNPATPANENRITLFSKDTQYSYVSVDKMRGSDICTLRLNNYVHGVAHTTNPAYLKLDYSRLFAAVTKRLGHDDDMAFLCIGGGAFVMPRYVNWQYSGSHIDIVEIDPALAQIAESALGFEKKANMRLFHMDARNYINACHKDTAIEGKPIKYDFIYGDAFGDNAIPFQLVTREFNDYLNGIMSDNGAYMVNVIDTYSIGRFLGAYINTLEQTFPYVKVISRKDRETNFVVVASKKKLDFAGLENLDLLKQMDLWVLSKDEIDVLKQKAKGLILTDNFAPTDNLISSVAALQAKKSLANQAITNAKTLTGQGKIDEAVKRYEDAASIHPPLAFEAYREIGHIYADQKKWADVVAANKKALASDHPHVSGVSVIELYLNTWDGLNKLGKTDVASVYLKQALAAYQLLPEAVNGYHETTLQLGYALLAEEQYDEIIPLVSQSIKIAPANDKAIELLAFALIKKNEKQAAIEVLKTGAAIMAENGEEEKYLRFQSLLRKLTANNEI